jgi:hypothetical protein
MSSPFTPAPLPQPQPEPPKPKRRAKVEPQPESRLEALLLTFHRAKEDAEAAAEVASDLKSKIRAELLAMAGADLPDAFDISEDPEGRFPGYTMSLKTSRRLDTSELKENEPGTYDRYAKWSQPSWELRERSSGGRRR